MIEYFVCVSDCSGGGVFEVDSIKSSESSWLAWSLWDHSGWLEDGLEEILHSCGLVGEGLVVSVLLGVVVILGGVVSANLGAVGIVIRLQFHKVHGGVGGR